ncbi:hypothetical protein Tco_0193290, partial [Tanacetum coccineum]
QQLRPSAVLIFLLAVLTNSGNLFPTILILDVVKSSTGMNSCVVKSGDNISGVVVKSRDKVSRVVAKSGGDFVTYKASSGGV